MASKEYHYYKNTRASTWYILIIIVSIQLIACCTIFFFLLHKSLDTLKKNMIIIFSIHLNSYMTRLLVAEAILYFFYSTSFPLFFQGYSGKAWWYLWLFWPNGYWLTFLYFGSFFHCSPYVVSNKSCEGRKKKQFFFRAVSYFFHEKYIYLMIVC